MKGNGMKRKLTVLFIVDVLVMIFLAMGVLKITENRIEKGENENELVLLREIEYLTSDENGNNPASKQIDTLYQSLGRGMAEREQDAVKEALIIFGAGSFLLLISFYLYIYISFLRPMQKMQIYAAQLAKGDMKAELRYSRHNGLGEFTWALDQMRKEVLFARESECAAVQKNKTIIATLSHDIKTPIASIRAYAEALEAGIDSNYETREHYIEVMMRKCDEVTGLVNDLVLHSLTELNQIVIEKCDVDMAEALQEILNDLKTPLVELEQPFEKATVSVDTKRLAQLLENLLNNAAKYTPGKVCISTKIKENFYEIHVRDWGNGIPPEDMPFITEKFYRGKNKGEQPGSGLGLYIVKHITEKMDGRLELINCQPGLEAVILLPCKNA